MKVLAVITVILTAMIIGCGGSSDESATSAETEPEITVLESPPNPEREAETEAWIRAAAAVDQPNGDRWAELEKAAGPLADELIIPHGSPPEEVVVKQLKKGKGEMIEPGDSFGISFSSYDYETGQRTQKYSSGRTLLYHYGTRETVKAWDPGLKEMREGEMRELIVPSKWAYGQGAQVYLVELLIVS